MAGSGIDAVVAVCPSLSRDEADVVHGSQLVLDVLRSVLEQVQGVGQDAMAATIINTVHSQERKSHGRKRSSEAVAQAMVANHCAEQRGVADAEAKRTRTTLKQLREEHERALLPAWPSACLHGGGMPTGHEDL